MSRSNARIADGHYVPRAQSDFDRVLHITFVDNRLVVYLAAGCVLSVPLEWHPRLLAATPAARSNWRVRAGGYAIHWPELDEDITIAQLLRRDIASILRQRSNVTERTA